MGLLSLASESEFRSKFHPVRFLGTFAIIRLYIFYFETIFLLIEPQFTEKSPEAKAISFFRLLVQTFRKNKIAFIPYYLTQNI